MTKPLKLTPAQQAIVDWLNKTPNRYIKYYNAPGDYMNRHSGWYWPKHLFEGAPKPDGRSLDALDKRGVIVYIEDGDYELSKEYRT